MPMTLDQAMEMVATTEKNMNQDMGEFNLTRRGSKWDRLLDRCADLQQRLGEIEQSLIDTTWGEVRDKGDDIESRLHLIDIYLRQIERRPFGRGGPSAEPAEGCYRTDSK